MCHNICAAVYQLLSLNCLLVAQCEVHYPNFGGLGMDSKNSTFNLPSVIEPFLLSLNIEAPLFSPVENG